MEWHDATSCDEPLAMEETPAGNLYFRRGITARGDGAWAWREAVAPAGLGSEREALEDVVATLDMGAVPLLTELLPVATPEELPGIYDRLLEAKLTEERRARGYTVREPSDYGNENSDVVRYKQDARDWKQHRDRVMLTGLTLLNAYQQTGAIPTVDEFLAALPTIRWTIDPDNQDPSEGMEIDA